MAIQAVRGVRTWAMLAGGASLAVLAVTPACAQDAAAPAEEDAIIVTGIRASLEQAADIKREAEQVMDVITAEDVGKLPDANVAEALQRITGVQISRNRGEGDRVQVRGLQQTQTLLNGRVIFTASVWGKSAVAEFSAYCASKHAVIGLTRSFAHELAPRGITVNAVCPGWVRTEASLRSLKVMSERAGRSETSMLDDILAGQALGGLMEPEDVAPLYLFLASDAAASITGQSYGIDRGEVMS